jgi:hypothetical protein
VREFHNHRTTSDELQGERPKLAQCATRPIAKLGSLTQIFSSRSGSSATSCKGLISCVFAHAVDNAYNVDDTQFQAHYFT